MTAGFADGITLKPQGDKFNEVLRDSAQISGVVVAGVLRHGSLSGPSLVVDVPPERASDSICVRVVSADGLYEAQNTYPLPKDWRGGQAEVAFPTGHAALLETLPRGAIAVRAQMGACGQNPARDALSIWNGADAPGPVVLVNAFAADEVFAYVGDTAIRCDGLDMTGLSAFGHACPLPADLRGDVELTLYRIKGGKAPDPTRIAVWLGTP